MRDGMRFPTVEIRRMGQKPKHISSVEDAAAALAGDWPRIEGRAYQVALQTCVDAMRGAEAPDTLRVAFVSAAIEAGFQVDN